jgi:hypothetical protein
LGKSMASASVFTALSLGETTGAAQPLDEPGPRVADRHEPIA